MGKTTRWEKAVKFDTSGLRATEGALKMAVDHIDMAAHILESVDGTGIGMTHTDSEAEGEETPGTDCIERRRRSLLAEVGWADGIEADRKKTIRHEIDGVVACVGIRDYRNMADMLAMLFEDVAKSELASREAVLFAGAVADQLTARPRA